MKEFWQLCSKLLKKPFLWAKDNSIRAGIVILLVLIILVPWIEMLQDLIKGLPYSIIFNNIFNFFYKIPLLWYLVAILFILFFIWIRHLSKEVRKTSLIEDKLNDATFNKWSIPLDSGWTIQKCEDFDESKLGNMLSVTNSEYSGTLKGAYGWYDYEFSFLTKIDKDIDGKNQNFSVVVRSEDNLNGVMLQITKTHLYPHLLFNGSFIKDTDSDAKLPTVLKEGNWYKVKIKVTGNNIDIYIDNYQVRYKIPNKILTVENRFLRKTSTLRELIRSDEDIKSKESDAYKLLDTFYSLPKDQRTEEKREEMNQKFKDIPPSTKVVLDFQKGSVGFRESGPEHAYFKDIMIKKCE